MALSLRVLPPVRWCLVKHRSPRNLPSSFESLHHLALLARDPDGIVSTGLQSLQDSRALSKHQFLTCRPARVRGWEASGGCQGSDAAVSLCASRPAQRPPSACRDCQKGCAVCVMILPPQCCAVTTCASHDGRAIGRAFHSKGGDMCSAHLCSDHASPLFIAHALHRSLIDTTCHALATTSAEVCHYHLWSNPGLDGRCLCSGRGQEAKQDLLAAHHLEGPCLLAAAPLAAHACEAHQAPLRGTGARSWQRPKVAS